MRRGFKTEAKGLALELRAEIGLDAHAPFDPYAFASEYGIPVVQLSDLGGAARDHFLRADGSALSGALIPNGSGVVILENDAQPLTRRRTTMCHELAHVVLEHKFGVSLSDERKCGLGGDQEAEADWLSGEMLIPNDGAFRLARANATDEEAADAYDVSLAVARWRMNHSGARKVMERARAKWPTHPAPTANRDPATGDRPALGASSPVPSFLSGTGVDSALRWISPL